MTSEVTAPAPVRIKFGTDGWRGIIADDFVFPTVRAAALGVARYLKANYPQPSLVVGHDTRYGSDRFAREVAAIAAAEGVKALLIDAAAPTQVSSWTVIDRRASGAVVITASHNPSPFNGIKYKPDFGGSATTEVTTDLENQVNAVLAEGTVASRLDQDGPPGYEVVDPRPSYFQQLGRMLDLDVLRRAGLRFAHDSMHGAGHGYLRDLLEGERSTVTEVRAHPDPLFGGVHPEPITQNLRPLLDLMAEGGHDLAVASDGDADRLGIVDEKGTFINQLQVYALLLLYLLEVRGWRGPAVRSLTSTNMAEILGKQYGIEIFETKVGFKYVGPKMTEVDAIMGGEESGGFGFRGHIPERDGLLAGLFLADMMVRMDKPLSAILVDLEAKVGPHFYDRYDLQLPRDGYDQRKDRIYARFREATPQTAGGARVVRTRDDDGFKLYLENGDWVLARGSGTEPVFRIYSEAGSPDRVKTLLDEMRTRVEEIK